MYSIDLDICKQLGADIVGDWSNVKFESVGFNSNLTQNNSLFVGLEGGKYNGSTFAEEAQARGATGFILNQQLNRDVPQILVDNVWAFVYRYSLIVRENYPQHLIAICGASGKTSMKHIATQIFPGKLLFTRRSFNLKLSIACTLLFLNNDIDYVFVECGHNVPGEIDDLGRFLKPDYVIYTKIEEEHMAFFKDLETIKYEQAQILNYTSKDVICDKDYEEYLDRPVFTEDLCHIDEKFISYKEIDYQLPKNYFSYGIRQTIAKLIILGDLLGVKFNKDQFKNITLPNMRGNRVDVPGHTIYDLSFNLNLGSLKNTIDILNHRAESVDFIYGYMAEAKEDSNKEAIDLLIACPYIMRVYTVNVNHEGAIPFDYEVHKDQLAEIIYIQGSKMNNLINLVCRLIDYYSTGEPKLNSFVHI